MFYLSDASVQRVCPLLLPVDLHSHSYAGFITAAVSVGWSIDILIIIYIYIYIYIIVLLFAGKGILHENHLTTRQHPEKCKVISIFML